MNDIKVESEFQSKFQMRSPGKIAVTWGTELDIAVLVFFLLQSMILCCRGEKTQAFLFLMYPESAYSLWYMPVGKIELVIWFLDSEDEDEGSKITK